MEPMTLGSPVGSPMQSPGSPVPSAYLPSFLLGDSTTVCNTYHFIVQYLIVHLLYSNVL